MAAHPSRRALLRAGGVTLTLGALLVGCSSDGDPTPVEEEDAATEERRETAARGAELDLSLLNTVLSLEVLIIDTYQTAVDSGFVQGAELAEAVAIFQQHHHEHRDAVFAAVESAGGDAFTTANPVVKAALVDPALLSVAAERDVITLARELELAAAQLAVHLTTMSSTQELRSLAMSIGSVAARHATVLDLLGELGSERLATFPTGNPLPSDAVVPN